LQNIQAIIGFKEGETDTIKQIVDQAISKTSFANQILLSNWTLDLVNDSRSSYREEDSFRES
jgi:hypothetical protein